METERTLPVEVRLPQSLVEALVGTGHLERNGDGHPAHATDLGNGVLVALLRRLTRLTNMHAGLLLEPTVGYPAHEIGQALDPNNPEQPRVPYLRHHACGMVSFNDGDVQNHYCGHCKVFLADVPPPTNPVDGERAWEGNKTYGEKMGESIRAYAKASDKNLQAMIVRAQQHAQRLPDPRSPGPPPMTGGGEMVSNTGVAPAVARDKAKGTLFRTLEHALQLEVSLSQEEKGRFCQLGDRLMRSGAQGSVPAGPAEAQAALPDPEGERRMAKNRLFSALERCYEVDALLGKAERQQILRFVAHIGVDKAAEAG